MKHEFNKVWFCVAVLAVGLLVANIKQAAASEQTDKQEMAGLQVAVADVCGYQRGSLEALGVAEAMAIELGRDDMRADVVRLMANAKTMLSKCPPVGELKSKAIKLVEATK